MPTDFSQLQLSQQVVFEAEVLKNNSKAVIGIDDVYFTTDLCFLTSECDFEGGDICSYTNSPDDTVDWLLSSPSDIVPGPPHDHSEDSATGKHRLSLNICVISIFLSSACFAGTLQSSRKWGNINRQLHLLISVHKH